MIRQGTCLDRAKVFDMVGEFNHGYYGIPVNREKLHNWYDLHLSTGVMFVGPRSFISALLIVDPIRDHLAVVETGWYADDGNGAKLLLRLIKYAKEQAADELRVCTLNTSPQEAEHVLTRLGFEIGVERSHRLQL